MRPVRGCALSGAERVIAEAGGAGLRAGLGMVVGPQDGLRHKSY